MLCGGSRAGGACKLTAYTRRCTLGVDTCQQEAYMEALKKLLSAAQRNCDPPTVIALKDRLGVSRQAIYDWRSGEKSISDEYLARVIELAGADMSVALDVRRESARSDHERAMWRSLSKRIGKTAAAVTLTSLLVLPALPAHAEM